MRTTLPLTALALALALPASASAYGYAPDGTFVLPPDYADYFDLGRATTYDPFGPFPTALLYVAEGAAPATATATASEEGQMTLIGRRHRLRIQLECPPGRVSRVPADGLVPRCSP